jgi:PAS domain-containing protein
VEFSIPNLFEVSSEPVLLVDASSGLIIEANRAAASALGRQRADLLGLTLPQLFDEPSKVLLTPALQQARTAGTATASCCLAGASGLTFTIMLTEVRVAGNTSVWLIQLRPTGATTSTPARSTVPARSAVMESIEAAAFGFVVTDLDWRVQYANAAFVEMLGIASMHVPPEAPLTRWLQFSPAHLRALRRQVDERRATSEFSARLQCELGRVRHMEVCAVAVVPSGDERRNVHPCWGFTLLEVQAPRAVN